ncbi:hypothetical protein GOBAR_DD04157 [Gossypium barbadense]|nr:hypothetical protein GOBAR_DD04157 [Gossypium barbadense]
MDGHFTTKANNNLYILEYKQKEASGKDSIAHVIYQNSGDSEATKRPRADYMKMVQEDITDYMQATAIDWLVRVAGEYRLLPETLFTCMMIACKYEETTKLSVQVICHIADNKYRKEEILQMESAVLNYLKFEMAVPTAHFFLRQFVSAAEMANQDLPLHFECMANYIAQLSLVEYTMLRYGPSIIAASAAFLARFLLSLRTTLGISHCTLIWVTVYCLYRDGGIANLVALSEKYGKFKESRCSIFMR